MGLFETGKKRDETVNDSYEGRASDTVGDCISLPVPKWEDHYLDLDRHFSIGIHDVPVSLFKVCIGRKFGNDYGGYVDARC